MIALKLENILQIGQTAVVTKTVQHEDALGNYSKALREMMATPAYVNMVIKSAVGIVDKLLPDGYITVGSNVFLQHEHPTAIGMSINVKTTLKEIKGSHLFFEVLVWDEIGETAHGTHERIVVLQEKILKKAKERFNLVTKRAL